MDRPAHFTFARNAMATRFEIVLPVTILAAEPQIRYDFHMTQLLERAFTEASKLPEKEQDVVAALLLEELAMEDRRNWSALSKIGLSRAYSDDEPDYPASLVRNHNNSK